MRSSASELMYFLNDNAKNSEAKNLIDDLKPLIQRLAEITSSSKWVMATEVSCERLAAIGRSMDALSGRNGTKCIAVSVNRLFPKPEWMDAVAYDAAMRTALKNSLGENLDIAVWDGMRTMLGAKMKPVTRAALGTKLGLFLSGSIRDDLWKKIGVDVWNGLWSSLFLCLGFALIGDRETTKCLTNTVESYADGILLFGFNTGDPKSLIVIIE